MKCNLCGCSKFLDMNTRKHVRCADCNSFERTRLLWLFLMKQNINRSAKVLHLAPERGVYQALSSMVDSENYTVADFAPEQYAFAKTCKKIDLCELDDQPSFYYDFIIHSHVLEHVPCNIAYTLYHLHRMLKTEGKHIFSVPFFSGKYDECFQDLSDEERVRRFCQNDHVRRFGIADIGAHLGKILNVPEEFDATKSFHEDVLAEANIPSSHWKGFSISTVFVLDRNDMTLLS